MRDTGYKPTHSREPGEFEALMAFITALFGFVIIVLTGDRFSVISGSALLIISLVWVRMSDWILPFDRCRR
jgi:hypothetical protein